ncbi:hypothetical protein [Ilumatobacter fluminis]|uniref:hypothetical protein n=1 Tax=Ilumatobacter fluminis TaxID=467091 RepID=UPI0010613A25|nr:hypothetical protein [Ilumatobacter fluminis]
MPGRFAPSAWQQSRVRSDEVPGTSRRQGRSPVGAPQRDRYRALRRDVRPDRDPVVERPVGSCRRAGAGRSDGGSTSEILGAVETEPTDRSGRTSSQWILVGVYVAALVSVFVLALTAPITTARSCGPSPEHADIELCVEAQQFSTGPGWTVAMIATLTIGVVAGGLAWRRWRSIVHEAERNTVVDTLPVRTARLRRRLPLVFLAALPLYAGLGTGEISSSSFVPGERVCDTRTAGPELGDLAGSTFESCEQHSVESQRISRPASRWSRPLLLVGGALIVATIAWWVGAWRVERTTRIREYRYREMPTNEAFE